MAFILRWISIVFSSAVLLPLLRRILVLLGFVAVSYVGIGALLDVAFGAVADNWSGMSANIVAWMSIAGVDRALNVILSAFSAKLALMGLTSAGVLQKVLWRPNQQGSLF